ncbi:MAG TPA: chemotaxis protein CheB [Thermoanaerobaculia bacterium]|nr:chemotaxis protein CheB [Thermoanaerobaculia bacterium]
MATRTRSKRPAKRAELQPGSPPRDDSAGIPEEQLTSGRRVGAVRVVGIGASAGGLNAFIELLSVIPADTGLAFVLIQHLDPRHESMLVDILAGATAIPVQEVADRMRIEGDHVYVIPPDTQMTIEGDTLRLVSRTPKVPHRPLDIFFRSLAEDRKSSAFGVVLSGNDADGALGLQAIRDAGGTTFAQSPESAEFDIMPRAAAVAADFVLPPGGIAERLVSLARGDTSGEVEQPAQSPAAAGFDRVLQLLRAQHSVDFSHFKRATLERRILRRVLLGNHDDLGSYADFLEKDSVAVETLYQDLLIGVTSFFREPARFEALKTVVFPSIVQNRGPQDMLRIWVAGCSTGEEVYSLAITLLEFLDGRHDAPRISIYGTDINEEALRKSRAAIYGEHALSVVSPERLGRFFTAAPGGYKIAKAVRELCVFAAHDVTHDPPFSRIDLVTCCNVLIYFDPELQKKAVALLQYALAPGGFLMLGSSENLRATTNQLTPVSAKPLIYRKRQTSGALATFDVAPRSRRSRLAVASSAPLARRVGSGAHDDDDTFLAAHLAPCGVLINDRMEITRIRGDVDPFIALEPGEASFNLFSLVRHHEVLAVLRPAVIQAFRERTTVTMKDILVVGGDVRRSVAFEVIPYDAAAPGHDRCWIVFHSFPEPARRKAKSAAERTEIDGLRQALAATIDDRGRLADEASAAAEEAQSSDEELRSTNEELETAKEELQSANEELSTLNDELRIRNTALVGLNDDIENLLGAVEVPILFVGIDLTVRRFNVTAGLLLNLRPDATGRPLRESKSTLNVFHLEKLVGAVIETANAADVEVQDSAGDWRLLRIRAYRTSRGQIDGAIVAVLDINVLKRSVLVAEEATRAATMLSQASALLASSLDYETTLESLAKYSTAAFADWCAVDLVNEDGSIRHLTVSHANPVLRDLALQFQQAAFREPERAPGAPQALRLRKSVLLTDIAESELSGVQPEAKITQLIGALGVRSLISVPLIVRDKVLGTTTFSSSRRRYEAVDLQLAEELSQRAAVAIDTAMLFREAESANRYKDAFLGTVAHELRTPLTSILGWIQLAKINPDMYGEAFLRIEESSSLLKVFTEDLLDITRIREQKLNMEMSEINLAAVVRSAIEMTALSASGRGIQVRLHLKLDPAPLLGDHVRLLQVMWNLLSNAIKFTPPGGEINVRLERDGNDALLSVVDTGVGISAEFVPHVFDLYRQADESSSTMPGLGIGLFIVAQILRLHGGTGRVESPGVGRGSTFIITLPLRVSDRAAGTRSPRPRLQFGRSGGRVEPPGLEGTESEEPL